MRTDRPRIKALREGVAASRAQARERQQRGHGIPETVDPAAKFAALRARRHTDPHRAEVKQSDRRKDQP